MLFHELEYFLMVAECLNYSVASQKLYISQPGLSKVIANLENQLGTQLLYRSTRKVELTEDGRRFYQLSKTYLEQCRALAQGKKPNTVIGSLSIVFGNVVDSFYMPSIISAFGEQYPGITVNTRVQDAEEMLKGIRSGKIDIGLISSFAICEPANIRSELLYPCKLQVVVSKDHPLARRKAVRLEELQDERFIFIQPTINRGSETLMQLCTAAGFTPKVAEYTSDFRLMFMLVVQKRGIAFNLTMPDAATYRNLYSVDIDLSNHPEFESRAGVALVWCEKCANPAVDVFLRTVRKMRMELLPNSEKTYDF